LSVSSDPNISKTTFKLDDFIHFAKYVLQNDQNIQRIRDQVVPLTLSEEEFWRNYNYILNDQQNLIYSYKNQNVLSDGPLASLNITPKKQPPPPPLTRPPPLSRPPSIPKNTTTVEGSSNNKDETHTHNNNITNGADNNNNNITTSTNIKQQQNIPPSQKRSINRDSKIISELFSILRDYDEDENGLLDLAEFTAALNDIDSKMFEDKNIVESIYKESVNEQLLNHNYTQINKFINQQTSNS